MNVKKWQILLEASGNDHTPLYNVSFDSFDFFHRVYRTFCPLGVLAFIAVLSVILSLGTKQISVHLAGLLGSGIVGRTMLGKLIRGWALLRDVCTEAGKATAASCAVDGAQIYLANLSSGSDVPFPHHSCLAASCKILQSSPASYSWICHFFHIFIKVKLHLNCFF